MVKYIKAGSQMATTVLRTVASAVAGGTASLLGGGKFANGAFSGAFVYLFNHAIKFVKALTQEELKHKAIVGIMDRSARRFTIRGYGKVYSYGEAEQVYLNRIATGEAYAKAVLSVASVVPIVRGGRMVYYFVMSHPIETMTAIETLDGYYGGSSPGNNWGSFVSGFENFTGISIVPKWMKP